MQKEEQLKPTSKDLCDKKKPLRAFPGAPREIRTPVLALKGLRPGPLDDGGIRQKFYHIFIIFKMERAQDCSHAKRLDAFPGVVAGVVDSQSDRM